MVFIAGVILLAFAACTPQTPGSLRYGQQNEDFVLNGEVNTKIDILWVIDNSSSMDVSQKSLRDKLRDFANKYLKPSWDIRMAAISTDVYLANDAFTSYRQSVVGGTTNYQSYHLSQMISQKMQAGKTTANDSKLAALNSLGVSLSSTASAAGKFTAGLKNNELYPGLKKNGDYARLIPGLHDGPLASFCFEPHAYFFAPDQAAYNLVAGPECTIRDSSTATGNSGCLNPASGEKSTSQCVNTYLNDTVHSGYPIIETKPPQGVAGDAAWVDTIVDRFMLNVSKGSSGSGSERGLASLAEFVDRNEKSSTAFFRKGSLRVVIFLTDEDDQSMKATGTTTETPFGSYSCDLNTLVNANNSKFTDVSNYIQNTIRYCCTGGSCSYPNNGCAKKTVDGQEWGVGICPDSTKLEKVSTFKTKMDNFFADLDKGGTAGSYFAVVITPLTLQTLQDLQVARVQSDDHLDAIQYLSGGTLTTSKRLRQPAVDVGTRYLEFADLVGNGSLKLDIGTSDYGVLLNSIGQQIANKKGRFDLKYPVTDKSLAIVTIIKKSGSNVKLEGNQYDFEGSSLVIKDLDVILSLEDGDKINVDYQPGSMQ